MLFLKLSV